MPTGTGVLPSAERTMHADAGMMHAVRRMRTHWGEALAADYPAKANVDAPGEQREQGQDCDG
jgi:hypothetical protein